jgi:type IV fimbrial biogenesis protein FimT
MELIAVVLIITVFAALAIPTAVIQLRDRRVQEAARRIGIVYREARMRALGRGSAVLVRFAGGNMTVHEARLGTPIGGNTGCADLPMSSCLNTNWENALSAPIVDGFTVPTTGELSDLTVTLSSSASPAVLSSLDICFTPMGRAFSRLLPTSALTPLGEAYVARLSRTGRTRTRQVVLMPNGTARMFGP